MSSGTSNRHAPSTGAVITTLASDSSAPSAVQPTRTSSSAAMPTMRSTKVLSFPGNCPRIVTPTLRRPAGGRVDSALHQVELAARDHRRPEPLVDRDHVVVGGVVPGVDHAD